MVTARFTSKTAYLGYLEDYNYRLTRWLKNTAGCEQIIRKKIRLNPAQKADEENTFPERIHVIQEQLLLQSYIEHVKKSPYYSTNNLCNSSQYKIQLIK